MPKKTYRYLSLNENEIDDMIGLIDGCIGSSDSPEFDKVFKPIMKRLKKLQRPGKVNKFIPKI